MHRRTSRGFIPIRDGEFSGLDFVMNSVESLKTVDLTTLSASISVTAKQQNGLILMGHEYGIDIPPA